MQRMFSTLKQAVRKSVLVLGLISLLSLPGLFMTQPSLAATPNQKLIQQENMDKEGQAADREQAYEEQVKAAKNPEKVYEENLKEERQENPGGGIVEKAVEGTKDLVNKATGND